MLPPCKMSNFLNSLKAPTMANQNLAKVDLHVGHFKKICWEPSQKSPETETKTDKPIYYHHMNQLFQRI